MKVLAINGSPKKDGGTYLALKLVTDELNKAGIETETVHIGTEEIRGCTGCGYCKRNDKHLCIYADSVNDCLEKAKEIDGILLGAPVYYAGIAGTMKCFLDRFFFAGAELEYKVGACVTSVRRAGDVTTYQQMNNYFNLRNVLITPSFYWNGLHGTNEEQIAQDEEGMQIMRMLGRNMAWLMKVREAGNAIPLPETEPRKWTNFIH
ncbi:MAG: flavodoxin family protein [Anaerofustis sp.]